METTFLLNSSTPTFSEFDPTEIPFQDQVIDDVFHNFDYSLGTHEVLLSGSVGSAKSILMAHIGIRLCLEFPRAQVLLGRQALTDLKDTIYKKVQDHMEGTLEIGSDYKPQTNIAHFDFLKTGSEIMSRSWGDKRFQKFRSLELTAALIEELTENGEEYKGFYNELLLRIGRTPHIPIKLVICATNPDAPSHWAYKHFIEPNLGRKHPTRHVYYSRTEDNPYLPRSYVEQLKREFDPKMARRMLYGEWIEIDADRIYYAYQTERNYRDSLYTINPKYPVHITYDFNIGVGKPMSCIMFQYIDDTFHFFSETIIHSARTAETVEDMEARGLLKLEYRYVINGDAAGKHRDTRSNNSDYDILRKEFSIRNLNFVIELTPANPPVRDRHNTTNAYCFNSVGETRLLIYKDAPIAHEGMRLTELKKGAGYIEDDSKAYQHVTTAVGYGIILTLIYEKSRKSSRTREL